MAVRGKRPNPTYLKIVKNVRKSRINQAEAQPPRDLPQPPDLLSVEALEEWNRVSGDLYTAGLLTKIDRAVLALYCQCWGRWLVAERIIAADAARDPDGAGLLARTSNGTVVQAVAVGVARRAMHDCARFASGLGMTPSSRSRVTAVPPSDPNDPESVYFPD
jgi:P27 family predicted phage terminase small subunit